LFGVFRPESAECSPSSWRKLNIERARRERTRTKRESWETKMINPPDLSTCSFTAADNRPVRVLLALNSPVTYVSSVATERRVRSALIGPDKKIVWRRRMTMEARTA
jgi:hypothetical protein